MSASFRYRSYGEIAQYAGSATPAYLGYAGELRDPSGLVYLRARWYDPVNGRFMTTDPVDGDPQNPATLNAYLYGGANPAMNADPSGLFTGGLCVNANWSLGGWALYQLCPIVVATNGDIGWTATIGSGLSPSLSVSATGGVQFSTAESIEALTGPFYQGGGSAGAGLVGGTDYFWNEDGTVQGISAGVGSGGRLTGAGPFEVHGGTTNTVGERVININRLTSWFMR